MPAEVKPDRIEASQAGNGLLSETRIAKREIVATDLTKGSMRSVQTVINNSLQCRPLEELGDRARSYPERR